MSLETKNNYGRGIILIPYAELDGYQSGVNIANQQSRRETYIKNCCVACVSARKNNGDSTDVALVTNISLPAEYESLLQKNNVRIISEDFDLFNFSGNYSWSLAFYKLCALYKIVRENDYKNYAYLDSDVYVQNSFDDIWAECEESILLYDINHGLQVAHYRHFLEEVKSYTNKSQMIVHYGGEFFASNRENVMKFTQKCLDVFTDMKEKNFVTTHGDEFIISVVASQLKELTKNAGAYVYRFWTGAFRLVSTCYQNNEVVVLHVPDEKESGMIKIFEKHLKKDKAIDNNKIHKLLHLRHRSSKVVLGLIKQKLLRG